jgi:hypothetical protein
MNSLRQLFLGLSLGAFLLGCTSTPQTPPPPPPPQHEIVERWNFGFDGRAWKLGHQAATRHGAIREYVLPGQTVQKWTELVTSVYFVSAMAPRPFFEEVRKKLSTGCPSLQVTILEESPDTILFEWQHGGCQGFPAQHEIRRITTELTGTYTLSFVEKTYQMAAEKRAAWLGIIKSAKLASSKQGG